MGVDGRRRRPRGQPVYAGRTQGQGRTPGARLAEKPRPLPEGAARLGRKERLTSIALPRLATGVGGLDWDLVRPELEAHLGSLDIPVIIYTTYHAGQAGKEPL